MSICLEEMSNLASDFKITQISEREKKPLEDTMSRDLVDFLFLVLINFFFAGKSANRTINVLFFPQFERSYCFPFNLVVFVAVAGKIFFLC